MTQENKESPAPRNSAEHKNSDRGSDDAAVALFRRFISLPAEIDAQHRQLAELAASVGDFKTEISQCRQGLQSVARQIHQTDTSVATLTGESQHFRQVANQHAECIEAGISRIETKLSSQYVREQIIQPLASQILVAVDMADSLLEHNTIDPDVYRGLSAIFLQILDGCGIGDRSLRDFRRMNGRVQVFGDKMKYIPGPYKKEVRERFLRMLLSAQKFIHDEGPAHVKHIKLITLEELEEIRRIWVMDKHEIEDVLPSIYEEELGSPYPGKDICGNQPFDREDLEMLETICGNHYQLVRDLINVELKEATQVRRNNLMKNLENSIKRNFYEDEDDALKYARSQQQFMQDKVEEWDRLTDEYIEPKVEASEEL